MTAEKVNGTGCVFQMALPTSGIARPKKGPDGKESPFVGPPQKKVASQNSKHFPDGVLEGRISSKLPVWEKVGFVGVYDVEGPHFGVEWARTGRRYKPSAAVWFTAVVRETRAHFVKQPPESAGE